MVCEGFVKEGEVAPRGLRRGARAVKQAAACSCEVCTPDSCQRGVPSCLFIVVALYSM